MLKQQYRIRLQRDFDRIHNNHKKDGNKDLIIKYSPNNKDISRFAFIISNKISKKAVERNKLRRQMREVIRLKLDNIKPGYDVIFFAKKNLINQDYKKIESSITHLLQKTGIL